MIAVIFEVWPIAEHKQTYLDLAGGLRTELEQIDGFISVERFESLTENGKILSLSFWRDEEAVTEWRNHSEHRAAQATEVHRGRPCVGHRRGAPTGPTGGFEKVHRSGPPVGNRRGEAYSGSRDPAAGEDGKGARKRNHRGG